MIQTSACMVACLALLAAAMIPAEDRPHWRGDHHMHLGSVDAAVSVPAA